MDPRSLQEIANQVIAAEESAISKIDASTVIEYIDGQLQSAASKGLFEVKLSFVYQPMKKFYEDSKITDQVETHYSELGFNVRIRTSENTAPYLEITFRER